MPSARRKELGTKAASTGTGAGTLLLYTAEHLSPTYAWLRPWLLYLAPLASMLSAWAWLYIERFIAFAAERSLEWLNVKLFLRDKRKIRDRALRDPNSTPEHRAEMQRIYEVYCEAAMRLKYAQLVKLVP